MAENNKERLEVQRQINEALDKGSDITKAFGQVLQANLNKEEKISGNLKDRVKILSNIVSITSGDLDLKEKSSKLSNMAKTVEKEITKIRAKQLLIEKQFGAIGDKRVKAAKNLLSEAGGLEDKAKELENIIAIVSAEGKRVNVAKELTDVQKEQGKVAMAVFNKLVSNIKKVPAGGMFLNAIGLSDKNLLKIGENFNKYLTGEVKGFGKVFDIAGKAGVKNLGKMAAGAAGIGISIGLAVVLFKSLFKIAKAFSAVTDKLGESFGVMGTNLNNGVVRNLRSSQVAAIGLGFDIKDLISTTTTLSDQFGIGLNAASEISSEILDSGKAMGMSTDQATKLFGTLMSAGNMSASMAESLAENTYQLAAQNNVNPSAVMSDMADSAELIAKFGADNLGSITKAAIQARKMGLNLKTVESIADSLLDFQSSLNAEIEASVITGKQLNLQKARELALTGDLSGMMDNVLKQVGGEAEFAKMNVFQRKSLAKALGQDVVTMEKLVSAQDESVVKSKSFVDLMGKDGMSALTSIVNELKALGKIFVEKVGPHVMDMVKGLKSWLDGGGMEKLVGFTESLGNMMISIVNNMDLVMGSLGALMGASIGFMFGGGPVGAALGLLAGGMAGGMMGSQLKVNDFESSGGSHLIATPSGRMLETNPNDTVFGTTKVNDFASGPMGSLTTGGSEEMKQMKNELSLLRSDMASYFGSGGSLGRQIGSEFQTVVENG